MHDYGIAVLVPQFLLDQIDMGDRLDLLLEIRIVLNIDPAAGNAGRDCFRGVGLRLGDGDADILPLHLAAPFSPALFG